MERGAGAREGESPAPVAPHTHPTTNPRSLNWRRPARTTNDANAPGRCTGQEVVGIAAGRRGSQRRGGRCTAARARATGAHAATGNPKIRPFFPHSIPSPDRARSLSTYRRLDELLVVLGGLGGDRAAASGLGRDGVLHAESHCGFFSRVWAKKGVHKKRLPFFWLGVRTCGFGKGRERWEPGAEGRR